MTALILYRSHYGNTKRVAETLAAELQAMGHGVVIQDLRRRLPDLAAVDLLLVGAPTRMGKPPRKARRVLKRLRKRGFERPIAVFDTYGPIPTKPDELEKAQKWLSPGAAGIIQETARTLGLAVHPAVLRCEVKSMKGPLADGEQAKVQSFIKELVAALTR